MAKLLDSNIKKLRYAKAEPKQHIEWDDSLPCFGIRVYPSGKKSFVITYRVKGRKRIVSLGLYGSRLTLDEARRIARTKLAQAANGEDPKAEEERARNGSSFKDLCAAYMKRHAKVHKKSWAEDQRRIDKYLVPAFGTLRVDAVSRADVAKLHSEIGEQYPYMANRVLEQLSKMYELAVSWGFLDEDAANPAKRIQAFKEEKRDRWVRPDELPSLAKAINEESNLYGRQGIWLYLLTGLRRDELLSVRWADIDSNRNELVVTETKTGRKHYVPLSKEALAILDELPREKGNPYILPGSKAGHHLVNIEKIWRRVRKAAKVEDVRLHDLRRTVGSWLAQKGNSLHLIGKVLNHSSQSTTAVYARFAQDQVRQALEEHGKELMEIAKKKPADVVPLTRKTSTGG